jgi:hypothetical protein
MTKNEADRFLDENLRAFGQMHATPAGPSAQARARAAEQLAQRGTPALRFFRRPALLSGMGLAAALALAALLIYPGNGGPTVQAATVLEKLSKQVGDADLIDVGLKGVEVDEISIDGHVQLAEAGLAGDVNVLIREEDPPITIDASFALTAEGGWVLIRKLVVPDAKAQAMLDMFLPRGSETLLILPKEIVAEAVEEGLGEHLDEVRQLASGQVVAFVKEVLNAKADIGAKTRKRSDGTIELTIKVENAETLRNLMTMVSQVMGEDVEGEVDVDEDDIEDLLGVSVRIIYDPRAERVRSFAITGLADVKGTITVSLLSGGMDAELLDSARVAKSGTRVIDVGVLMNMFSAFDNGDSDDE